MSSVFDDLIDQEAVITTLKDAVAASKDSSNNSQVMTHSWLFTGPPGSGRSNAAVAFAAALLCEQGGCATCINCTTVIDGSHADIELIRTEGLSIKVDEVRELITRTSWSPSVGNYRVVVIEEPGARTVWLLCAPTLTDIIPTIRSRCRHLTLRTPSISAVAKLLVKRDGIDPKMAKFAASAAQGHIGRAKYLATNKVARETREKILNIPSTVTNLASAFEAANILLELAKEQANLESESRDEIELMKLKESYGTTGSRLATGGSKAVKELEKEQKNRTERIKKDFIYSALIDFNIEILKSIKNELRINEIQDLNKVYSINKVLKNNSLNTSLNINLQLESLFIKLMDKNAKI